jgi:hypothetical protein
MPGALGYVWDPVGGEWVKIKGDADGNVQVEGTVTVDTSLLATEATLAEVKTAVDGVEPLLAGGLPVALDGGALKVKEQSPITGFATEVSLAKTTPATTPVIYNVTMTLANTEYSQALPANCKKFLIHTRAGEAFRLAFVTGKVATPTEPYFSITPSDAYSEDLVLGAAVTLYFASATAGAVAEIIAWS